MIQKSVPLMTEAAVDDIIAHVTEPGIERVLVFAGAIAVRNAYEAERQKQLAEISTLRKSLEECAPYMQHTEGCTAIPRPFTTWKHGHDGVGYDPQTTMKTGPCTCGLSALLSQHQPTGT